MSTRPIGGVPFLRAGLILAVLLTGCAPAVVVDPVPTSGAMPFAPRSTMPARLTPTLMPTPYPTPLPTSPSTSQQMASETAMEQFRVVRIPDVAPTDVPLPQSCLRPPFAADADLIPGCTHYEIELTIDLENAQVTGHQQIEYTNAETTALQELVLHLHPNSPNYGGRSVIEELRVGGQPYAVAAEEAEGSKTTGTARLLGDGSLMSIPLGAELQQGQLITLEMGFVVDVPQNLNTGHGLFSYVLGTMALPNVYPQIAVVDNDGWNLQTAPVYGDDVYADVATYDVRVSAPPEVTLIASGVCVDLEAGRWRCDAEPMRDFVLIVAENADRVGKLTNGVVVNSYFYPRHRSSGQTALDVAVDAMNTYTKLFGPYPYTEVDVVETPALLGGMEYGGLVVVEDNLYAGSSALEWLVSHEIAHQWWYGVVGSDQIDHPWLDESLTSYSTMLYYEEVYGEQRAQGILNGEFKATESELAARGQSLPIGLPAEEYGAGLYWDVLYRKGPLYFHALRERLGDELFFEFLQTYYEDHRYGIATPETFLATLERVTGERHLDLYNKWVLGEDDSAS